MIRIPAIRFGKTYESLDKAEVKDHRTGHETSQVSSVMDGDIDGFIEAYLKKKAMKGNEPLTAVTDANDDL